MISPDDISFVGAELDPGSAAAVLLVGDLWARCPGPAQIASPARDRRARRMTTGNVDLVREDC
jgi:hypothetical protein